MDLQTILNAQMAEMRAKQLAYSDQLLLGELKLKLESVSDKTKPIEFDFKEMKPDAVSSWRGSYCELGIEYSKEGGGNSSRDSEEVEWESKTSGCKTFKQNTHVLPASPTTQDFLDLLHAVTGQKMEGYKGGDFTMHKNVAVYLGNYGESYVCGYKNEKEACTVAPVDVSELPDKVVIITRIIE